MLGMISMIGQQIEIRETGRTKMGIGMIAVVFICPQAIETGKVVVPADLSWKISMMAKVLQKVESMDAGVKEMRGDFSSMGQLVDSHTTSIKQIEQQLGQLSASPNQRKNGSLPCDTIQNLKKDGHCMAIATRSGKVLTDPISAENLVQDRFQVAGSVDTEEFKSQLAEMRTQIAKLAEKPVQVPTPIFLESLMQMLNQVPSTQSINDLGRTPTSKSGKRKYKVGELDEETPTDPAREARRQEKRVCRTSKREAREKEDFEQQQRDAALIGAYGSGAPAPTSEDQTD
uniref:Integrase core domain containing protein n=1 Tax=Solanum tuberosum TaxID=4113 RepID=M1DJD5_SOLTU